MRASTSVAAAQMSIPAKAETVPFSILPTAPKKPTKQIALRIVFSILIAAEHVNSATIAQMAEMSLSPACEVGNVAVPEFRTDISLCS